MRITRQSTIKKMSMSVLFLILTASLSPIIFISTEHAEASHVRDSIITVHFSPPTFSTIQANNMTFTQIHIEGCQLNGSIGEPLLPMHPIHILVPLGKTPSTITITKEEPLDYSSFIIDTPLFPQQEERPFCIPDDGNDFSMNEQLYQSDKPLNTNSFSNEGVSELKGYDILTLYVYPMDYTPDSSTLIFYQDMTLTISWSPSSDTNKNDFLRDNDDDRAFLASFVENPEILNSYDQNTLSTNMKTTFGDTILTDVYTEGICTSAETVDYVIVTEANLAYTTGFEYNWSDLLEHRQHLDGFNGRIVTIEQINSCTAYWNSTALFNDSAAHLREFCKDAYLDWDTRYILLGGTWQNDDTSKQIVPCRIFHDVEESYSYDTMPCDLYFSNLDGDWYDEAYASWGGGRNGENDNYAELSVGRLAVWNAETIHNSIAKIIWYDNCTNESWLRSAAFLGGDLGWASTSKQYMEEIRIGDGAWAQYVGFEEWNSEHANHSFDTSSRYHDADYPSESYAINAWKNAINNNEISCISHLDHGSWLNTLSLGTGSELSNSHFFIGTSQACLSGRYISGTSGASTFLSSWPNRGAFAMILNTGYGYGSSSSTYGASQQQHKIFWDYFFSNQSTDFTNWRLGDAMMYTKNVFSNVIATSSHAYCYVWYSWHLFGDPAQTLRITNACNTAPSASNPLPSDGSQHVSQNISQLQVLLTDPDDDTISWSIQTNPHIGNSSGILEDNGVKNCTVSNITSGVTYHWFVNVTDGTVWTNEHFLFTIQDDPTNNTLMILSPTPENNSINVDIAVNFSVNITDDTDMINWSITCTNGQHVAGINDTSGRKYVFLSNLSYNSSYMVWVNASDIFHQVTSWSTFNTLLELDTTPPEIQHISVHFSDPTDAIIGWENISCQVTDVSSLEAVTLSINLPDETVLNQSMSNHFPTDVYYFNHTFTTCGNYTFLIHAVDEHNNTVISSLYQMIVPPNWDINMDGSCNESDLDSILDTYGQSGEFGWIREDVYNNGAIQLLDLVNISNHYELL
ncbi:MAG: C25 family cysteine peptidase [Thermoplasmatota archaeon]